MADHCAELCQDGLLLSLRSVTFKEKQPLTSVVRRKQTKFSETTFAKNEAFGRLLISQNSVYDPHNALTIKLNLPFIQHL